MLSEWQNGSPEMEALTKHALRTLLKRGHPGALAVLGFSAAPQVELDSATVDPVTVPVGGSVQHRCGDQIDRRSESATDDRLRS